MSDFSPSDVSCHLKQKLTCVFLPPQSLESTRRMLQLVEEVRKICEKLNSCTKSEIKYGAAQMGSKCSLSSRRHTLGKDLLHAGGYMFHQKTLFTVLEKKQGAI